VPRLKRILLRDNATIVLDGEWDAVSGARKSLDVINEYRVTRSNVQFWRKRSRESYNTNKMRQYRTPLDSCSLRKQLIAAARLNPATGEGGARGARDANPTCEITEYGSHCPAREQCRDAAGASERSASSVMYHATLRACPIKLDVASARHAVSPCPCTSVHVHMYARACVCVCVCWMHQAANIEISSRPVHSGNRSSAMRRASQKERRETRPRGRREHPRESRVTVKYVSIAIRQRGAGFLRLENVQDRSSSSPETVREMGRFDPVSTTLALENGKRTFPARAIRSRA